MVSTAVTAIVFLIVGFTLEDSLKRLRRYPDEDKRRAAGDPTVHPDRGMEGWAMGCKLWKGAAVTETGGVS